MGLGIGTVLVLAGLAFGVGVAGLPDESASFGWTLAGLGVLVIVLALVVNARRHPGRPTG